MSSNNYLRNYNLQCLINSYTLIGEKASFEDYKQKAINDNQYVSSINEVYNEIYNSNQIIIQTSTGIVIKALPLSSVIPNIKNILAYIETKERYGNCSDSFYIALGLDIKSNLVTCYVYDEYCKKTYPHIWVETTSHNEDVVIDLTMNAIINKDGYYLMRDINKDNIIQSISNEELISKEISYEEYIKNLLRLQENNPVLK